MQTLVAGRGPTRLCPPGCPQLTVLRCPDLHGSHSAATAGWVGSGSGGGGRGSCNSTYVHCCASNEFKSLPPHRLWGGGAGRGPPAAGVHSLRATRHALHVATPKAAACCCAAGRGGSARRSTPGVQGPRQGSGCLHHPARREPAMRMLPASWPDPTPHAPATARRPSRAGAERGSYATGGQPMAYLRVHSRAVSSYRWRSVL